MCAVSIDNRKFKVTIDGRPRYSLPQMMRRLIRPTEKHVERKRVRAKVSEDFACCCTCEFIYASLLFAAGNALPLQIAHDLRVGVRQNIWINVQGDKHFLQQSRRAGPPACKLTKCGWGEPKVSCHTHYFVRPALPELIMKSEAISIFSHPICDAIYNGFDRRSTRGLAFKVGMATSTKNKMNIVEYPTDAFLR